MKIRLFLAASVAAVTCALPGPANAVPLLFDFAGPSGTAQFQLDSSPTPDFSSSFIGSDQFGFNDVAGIFGGVPATASTISFGNGIFASLSITAPNLGFTQFAGPNLFSGPPSAPIFSAGSFVLINAFLGNGTLNITEAQAAVPEPATWGMMLVGFGMAGAALRRHRRRASVRFA